MQIYLLRHGIAIDREHPECPADRDRFLTEKGRQRTRAACRGLAALGLEPEVVLSSPYLRALQTAELAMAELRLPRQRLAITDALLEDSPTALVDELQERALEVVVCVGHAPSLDLLAAHWIGAPGPVTRLKKAGCAHLDVRDLGAGGGELVALYPPRVLRRLATLVDDVG